MTFNRQSFFDSYKTSFGNLTQPKMSGIESLLNFIETDPAITDIRWIAYMLATIKHECADTFQPITERGQRSYFDKYEPDTKTGKNLGNTKVGDGYLFRGRGYVQITGRANYSRLGKAIGLTEGNDLLSDPDKALSPETAYKIMSYGMQHGSFTGKKLKDYINSSKKDYREARRIINALDQADKIAAYAENFESILNKSSIKNEGVIKNMTSEEKEKLNENNARELKKMDEEAINKLFKENMIELNKMYVPAGSMIKGLIMELARNERNTFIKLRNAVSGGHIVYYDFIQGDPELVSRIGSAMGLKEVTKDRLEVRNA